jgi:hypothetical protein
MNRCEFPDKSEYPVKKPSMVKEKTIVEIVRYFQEKDDGYPIHRCNKKMVSILNKDPSGDINNQLFRTRLG